MATRGNPGIVQSAKRIWQSLRELAKRAWQSPKRAWLIGGLVALATIIAVPIAVIGLLQDRSAILSQDAAQATLIAIEGEQLIVQKEIATFQASSVRTGPTATAIAERITQLQSTQEALKAEKSRPEATLSAILTQPAPALNASVTTRVPSQVQDVNVELIELTRFQNTITAKFRFINSGTQAQRMTLTFTSYLLDEATQKTYVVNFQSNPGYTDVPANDTIEAWAKYEISPDDHPQYLTVVLPNGVSFDHIPVQQ